MKKDLKSHLAAAIVIDPASYSADEAGQWIDLQGFASAVVELQIGVGGITFTASNKIEFVMEHADETDQSDAAVVTDSDVQGVSGISSGIVKALTAAHASASNTEIGYVGGKRYVKVKADFSGTHGSGTPIAALVVRGAPNYAPAA